MIDDERSIRKLLKASLDPEEYLVIEAEDGTTGIRLTAVENPDLVLLDLGLPDLDGVEVTRQIREWSEVPILILSARGAEDDKVLALDTGANDYITKPFGIPELMARMRVALRAASKSPAPIRVETGNLVIDLGLHSVTLSGQSVHLTKTEFKFISLLARNLGKVLTHTQILREVWGPEYVEELHYLRVYAQQIRQKIEADPAMPRYLLTETGIGYRLQDHRS